MENIDHPRSWYQFQFLLAKKLESEVWSSLQLILTTAAALSLGVWTRDTSKGVLKTTFQQDCWQQRAREGKDADLVSHWYGQTLRILNYSLHCGASHRDHSHFCAKKVQILYSCSSRIITKPNRFCLIKGTRVSEHTSEHLPHSSFLVRHKNVYFQALKWLFQLNECQLERGHKFSRRLQVILNILDYFHFSLSMIFLLQT